MKAVLAFILTTTLLGGCAAWPDVLARRPALPSRHMVAAADPRAVDAGLKMLEAGGTAVDAAIAVQAVLTLVEPQSSGIGGGAFLMHWDAAAKKVEAYDGRETAPASARPTLFLSLEGEPLDFYAAAKSGRAVGVPGVIAMLAAAHKDHGKLPWAQLFEPAITLAETGFIVSPRLAESIAETHALADFPDSRALFFTPDGVPLPAGTVLKNPSLADTLRRIAAEGPRGFYEGPVAAAIVDAVRHAPRSPRKMTRADLAAYRAKPRPPLCGTYRRYVICGMGPPSSGGSTVLAILKLLEPFDLGRMKPSSLETVHLISEASRLAYADRDRYLADPDFIAVPVEGLTDTGYLRQRSALIALDHAMAEAVPGTPPGAAPRAEVEAGEVPSTSHMSLIDDEGNAVAMTTSVETAFGANLVAAGFILNNQLTDFAFVPSRGGLPVANAPAAGKRPRSSMAPTLVFAPDGRLLAVVGSPGGSRIIAYVAQTLIGLLDWNLDMQSAIALPHHVAIGDRLELEAGTPLESLAGALARRGHRTEIHTLTSGLQGIRLTSRGFDGGADPRREGVAKGQ